MTCAAAMAPSAPSLFSTTKGWPIDSVSAWARTRATTSVEPPAGKWITTRTGFDGYGCAKALLASASRKARVSRRICTPGSARGGDPDPAGGLAPLVEQQPPEDAQVVQDPVAGPHVAAEAIDLVGDELQRFQAPADARRARPADIRRDVLPR